MPIDIEKIRFATELQSIASLALERRFRRLHVDTCQVEDIEVPVPEVFLYPLRAYLGDTGGYDASLPYNRQKTDEPARQKSAEHGRPNVFGAASICSVLEGRLFKDAGTRADRRKITHS